MAEFPAFPLWTDAYLGDTGHLTTIEHGAYLLLLMTAWRAKDGLLPNDDKLLARYAKLNAAQWARIRPILEPFFDISFNSWCQGRLTDELVAVRRLSKSQSKKAKTRWLKNNNTDNAAASSRQYQKEIGQSPADTSPTPTPTPTQSTLLSESTLHTHEFEDLVFEGEISALATKAGLAPPIAQKSFLKWKAKRKANPPADPLADWTIWVLNEFKPPDEEKPLTGRDLEIQRVGIANWLRARGAFMNPTQINLLKAWEANGIPVDWIGFEDWKQKHGASS